VPRRHRRRPDPDARPPTGLGGERREAWRGVGYAVRSVPGSGAAKAYRCPGCDQEIRPGTGHVVAWPPEDADDRRHWHTACWAARDRRAPAVLRGRAAPRY
jgi:hypothetical protein